MREAMTGTPRGQRLARSDAAGLFPHRGEHQRVERGQNAGYLIVSERAMPGDGAMREALVELARVAVVAVVRRRRAVNRRSSRLRPASVAAASASRCGALDTISAPANPRRSGLVPAGRGAARTVGATPYSETTIGARSKPARMNRSRTCADGASATETCATRSRMWRSRRREVSRAVVSSISADSARPAHRRIGAVIAEGSSRLSRRSTCAPAKAIGAPPSGPVQRAQPSAPGPSHRASVRSSNWPRWQISQ